MLYPNVQSLTEYGIINCGTVRGHPVIGDNVVIKEGIINCGTVRGHPVIGRLRSGHSALLSGTHKRNVLSTTCES